MNNVVKNSKTSPKKSVTAKQLAKSNLTKRKNPDWDNLDRGYRYLTLDMKLPHDLAVAVMGNVVEESLGDYKAALKKGGGRGLIQWDGKKVPSGRYSLWGSIWASVAKPANVYDSTTDTVKNYWAPWGGLKGDKVRLKFIKAPIKEKARIYAESYLRPGKPRIADRQLSAMQLDSIYNPRIKDIIVLKGGGMLEFLKNGGQVRKMQTAAGGPLQLTPEELKYYSWVNMSPELRRQNRNNRIKAYLSSTPSIGNFWEALLTYIGNRDPKNPHLNTGEAPNPGMRNPKLIILGVQKVRNIALRAALISDKVFDRQYFKALSSGNSLRVKAVRDLHFKGKSVGNKINKQLYHGTPEVFNEFKITDTADPIFHTTETKEVASKIAGSKGRVLNLFGYSKNPLRISDLGIVWHPSNIARELKVQLPRDKVRYPLELYERELLYKLNNNKTFREEANRSFMERELKGDSYVYKNEVEGGGDSYAFPTSRQLKLSNSVTYDDSGNIIPISQRDNFLINDIRYKQGGKMNILEFLKNGSGIHIKKENKGKFTSYCGGKVTNECILKGKNSSNPAIRKRATFAANARKWKHEDGGELIKKAQLGSQLPTAEDATKRYKNGDFIKEFLDNNDGHAVILGVMTNKPFHNQGSIVRKINYRMGIPSDTTYIETPPSLFPVKKVSRSATRYSGWKNNMYAGNLKDLYNTLKNRWEKANLVMRRKDGGTLKAQYGAPLNLSTEDIQGGLQYITQGLGKVWNIMNAPVVNVQPSTTAYLPNGSQIEIPGTLTGVVDDSFGKGGGGKKVGKKLLQSVAKSKDKGLNVTKKVDSAVRHGLVNVDQDLRHFGRGNRRMKPEDLIKEMDKHVELKEFAKHLSKRYSNLKRDNPQSMKDFKTLKNKYEDMLNDFLHNGIKKGQLGMALTLFNDSENPNAVGGEIVNSYIRNQLMIPYLLALKEEYEKWKLQMKQQANTLKSSLFDNLLNTGLSIGTDYLKSKLGIGTEKADS